MFMLVLFMASTVLFAAGRRQQTTAANDVRLKMLCVWNGGITVPRDQYNTRVAQAIREKIGVTVEFEGIMMNEAERLNLMFASGDMPDIVNAAFWGGGSAETVIIKNAAREGMLLPIDDMLQKYPNVARALDVGVISVNYLESEMHAPEFGGKNYLIPQETSGAVNMLDNFIGGVFVRADVPRTLGINEKNIKTADQLWDLMVRARDYGFKDVNGNDTIVATTFHNGWDYTRYSQYYSYQKLTTYTRTPSGAVTADALEPLWIDRQMFIWRMVKEGIMDLECFRTDDTLAQTKTGNGTVLMYGAHFEVGIDAQERTRMFFTNPEMRYTWVGPMNHIDGTPIAQAETNGRTGTPVIFFPNTCKDLDAAFRYIDFVNTPEGKAIVDYGIEGETFIRNAQGQPRFTPQILAERRSGVLNWDRDYKETVGWGYANQRMWYGNRSIDWFGERNPGQEDFTSEKDLYRDSYKEVYVVKQLPGYPINAFETQFPRWDEVREIMDGELEKNYRERAYFAATESEARRILTDYQNYLRTSKNGLFMEFLAFLTQKANSRSDIAF
jgi:putative aldouronate transport system substrate-binding protein